ncbi:hypothetical protein [Fusobacterium pseudoperiodonticum]|uniref:Uncharacterized protein n=1 Tax=Fusobacterium pseudoperiodonticum TaxID=2663009 RepID=A0A2D3PPM7_9FUSO|nr:hypothetical protein [Fusobacterium pseudoperiodonticum]ATV69577.1 hypothetical protein CTM98_02275 [Fusobacterium pseudoperiodonticum]
MERKVIYILQGKVAGATIPEGVNKKVKAYVKKLHKRGIGFDELSDAILQAFESNDIVGCFYICEDGNILLQVGN